MSAGIYRNSCLREIGIGEWLAARYNESTLSEGTKATCICNMSWT